MERRHDILYRLPRGRSESPPEVMLGLTLLGTSFVTGLLFGLIVA